MKKTSYPTSLAGELFIMDSDQVQKIQQVYNNARDDTGTCGGLIRGLDPQQAVMVLNGCRCCDRHQINKPSMFVLWATGDLVDCKLKTGEEILYNLQTCDCDCRHLSRWLCRGLTVEALCENCNE